MQIVRLKTGARMSQGICHAGVVYLAGQVAMHGGTTAQQMDTVLSAIDDLLEEAGSDRSHLLSVTILLADIDDFAEMNAVWDAWIADVPKPTRATFEARLASPALRVEVVATAALP